MIRSVNSRLLRIFAGAAWIGAILAVSCLPAAVVAAASPSASPAGGHGDVSRISVRLDTLTLLSGKQGDIEVLQLLRVRNSGDRPYFGETDEASGRQGGQMPEGSRQVFRVPLPEGAFDIAPSDLRNPQGMAEGPGGIFTTVPLAPGETLISYIYRIRPARSGWALQRQIDMPTDSINLLLGPGLELRSAPGFRLTERKTLGGVEYRRFRAGPFSAGSVLRADIGFGSGSSPDIWLGFGSAAAIVCAVALGTVLLVRRRRRSLAKAEGAGPPRPPVEPAAGREDLICQIALLDEQFDSGSIPEAAYETKRQNLKRQLAAMTDGERVRG